MEVALARNARLRDEGTRNLVTAAVAGSSDFKRGLDRQVAPCHLHTKLSQRMAEFGGGHFSGAVAAKAVVLALMRGSQE